MKNSGPPHPYPRRLICLSASQNKWRDRAEVTAGIKKITDERKQLDANQPNMTGTSDEELRPPSNDERRE